MAKGSSPQTRRDSTNEANQDNSGTGAAATDIDRNVGATAHGTTDHAAAAPNEPGAIEMLKQDHRKVERLFEQFEQSSEDQQKERLVGQICEALILHMRLEEDIFYPACREAGVEDDTMDEAQVEHDSAKVLLNDLLRGDSAAQFWKAKVAVLKEMIEHHVAEEEKPADGAFAQAAAHGIDDSGLATRLEGRKQELQRRAAGRQPIRAVSFNQEENMPRYGYPERDDRGRFTSDDDRGYGRSRYRDDDDGRYGNGRGRGHGGWYGDFEGHSEAARSRSDEGRYGGSHADDDRYGDSRRYGDDDRYGRDRDERGRFTSHDDDRRYDRERDERGRFMSDDDRGRDPRGRFTRDDDARWYPGRSRDDDDDRNGNGRGRGHGGWFGDSEGHSEAARSRGNDERRHAGQSRRDDDDDRRHGSGGHGGWYGDPRGHAEASRRGWQHRR